MIPYSLLDLSPVPEGADVAAALRNSGDLARHAEDAGYTRYWMAEHHNMPGIASAATAVALGYVAGQTSRIRVGSGGVMLPNHAPLVIAEQFGTLATLYPDRIDIGLGRAPGTDMGTARALRRGKDLGDQFPNDVQELIGYLGPRRPDARVRAVPGEGTEAPVWILGSSLYGAQLAAHLGLPYAFASHFAPAMLEEAVRVYRDLYQPSAAWPRPYFMLACNVFAAETDAEGRRLKTSMQQAFANLRSGRPGPLPRPVDNILDVLDAGTVGMVEQALSVSAVGSPGAVQTALGELIDRFQPDEMIFTGQIHDHEARKASFAIAAEAMKRLAAEHAA